MEPCKTCDNHARKRDWVYCPTCRPLADNIIIGGIGEAEVNPHATPEETLEKLYDVSEQCGYFTSKGYWGTIDKEIYIQTNEGNFKLTYRQGLLGEIDRIISRRFWTSQ